MSDQPNDDWLAEEFSQNLKVEGPVDGDGSTAVRSLPEEEESAEPDKPEVKEVDQVHDIPYNPDPYMNPLRKSDVLNDNLPRLPGEALTEEQYGAIILQIAQDKTLSKREKEEKINQYRNKAKNTLEPSVWGDRFKDVPQYIVHNGKKLPTVASISMNLKGDNTRLRGKEAIEYLRAASGTGRNATGYLWNSGFRIKVSSFAPGEIFDHQVDLIETLEMVGTNSNGQILSLDDSTLLVKMADFVLSHVTRTSLKDVPLNEIGKYISVLDLYTILSIGLCAMYPNGYPFARDCTHHADKDGTCDWSTIKDAKKVEDVVRLDFRYVVHPDKSMLTDRQLNIIDREWETTPLTDIEAYRNDFGNRSITSEVLNPESAIKSRLVIRDPFYADYRIETRLLAQAIESKINNLMNEFDDLGAEETYQRRSRYVDMYVRSVDAQRHSAWVEKILMTDEEGTQVEIGGEAEGDDTSNRTDLLDGLAELTRLDGVSSKLEEAMTTFKKERMVAVVGIPDYKCPACGKSQIRKTDIRPGIIPIPVTSYFFDIMASSYTRANIVEQS